MMAEVIAGFDILRRVCDCPAAHRSPFHGQWSLRSACLSYALTGASGRERDAYRIGSIIAGYGCYSAGIIHHDLFKWQRLGSLHLPQCKAGLDRGNVLQPRQLVLDEPLIIFEIGGDNAH